jgi:uncharacterized SAM-binding protein YcdF (DUF218 family)
MIYKKLLGFCVLFLGLLFTLGHFAGSIYLFNPSVSSIESLRFSPPQVDAIVCLAGGKRRIKFAALAWKTYWDLTLDGKSHLPLLYLSGVGYDTNKKSIIDEHFGAGFENILFPEHLVLEKESRNTLGNARWFANFAKSRGWKRILLVTSNYHLKRAHLIFLEALKESELEIQIETLSVLSEFEESGKWWDSLLGWQVTLEEYIKLLFLKSAQPMTEIKGPRN